MDDVVMVGSANPMVTVLIPVYNGEGHLRAAMDSILAQTLGDFELLVINDGSTDGSAAVVASYGDPRIVSVDNDGNRGLIPTLNRGLELARGKYVARMDCDDISHPERLARQVALLEANPGMALCGAWVRKFDAVSPKVCRYHTRPALLECGLIFDPVVAHPAVMLRRQAFRDLGLAFDPVFRHAEDYELWTRVARHYALGNVPEVLLEYRIHRSQVSQAHRHEQVENAGKVRRSLLAELGIETDAEEFEIHQRISTYSVEECPGLFRRADDWLCRVREANLRTGRYPDRELSLVLAERLVTLLKKMMEKGIPPEWRALRPRLLESAGLGWTGIGLFMLEYLRGNDRA